MVKLHLSSEPVPEFSQPPLLKASCEHPLLSISQTLIQVVPVEYLSDNICQCCDPINSLLTSRRTLGVSETGYLDHPFIATLGINDLHTGKTWLE